MTFSNYETFSNAAREQRLTFSREKGEAYAHADSRFANFERIGDYLDLDREQILLVYLMKHIDGIISSINYNIDGGEGIHGRIDDAIVYLEILQGMVAENSSSFMLEDEAYDTNT